MWRCNAAWSGAISRASKYAFKLDRIRVSTLSSPCFRFNSDGSSSRFYLLLRVTHAHHGARTRARALSLSAPYTRRLLPPCCGGRLVQTAGWWLRRTRDIRPLKMGLRRGRCTMEHLVSQEQAHPQADDRQPTAEYSPHPLTRRTVHTGHRLSQSV